MDLFFIAFLIFFSIIGAVDVIKYIFTRILKISRLEMKNSNCLESKDVINRNIHENKFVKLVRVDNFDNKTPKIIKILKTTFEFK